MKKKLYIDFDGMLNNYTGWAGNAELFEPRAGAGEFLRDISVFFEIYIFTTRNSMLVTEWLVKHGMREYVAGVTNVKEPAFAYIDDRAICFEGDYERVVNELCGFKAWWSER